MKYIVIVKEERLIESLLKDVATFGFLFLCIYVSRDSAWWTFFSGAMAALWVLGLSLKQAAIKFRSTEELRSWLDARHE